MSKAVKQSIAILAVLLFLSIGIALYTLLEKQKLQNQNKSLTEQVADYQVKQTQLMAEGAKLKEQIQSFSDKLAQKDKDISKYQSQYQDLKDKYDEVNGQVAQMSRERDDLKERATTITQERDRLMKELQDRPEKIVEKEKIVYKDREVSAAAPGSTSSFVPPVAPTSVAPQVATSTTSTLAQAQASSAKQHQEESYWAEIIKQKAALEIELEKAKKELDQSAIQIVELKKQGADFQLEIDKLKNEKDDIVHKIKYGEDLADNLSIELARARNDQKFNSERSEKLSAENKVLRSQLRQLNETKVDLEKTIQKLNNDKGDIQKKLVESETVIQGRIDDIWKIKKNVDQRFENMPSSSSSGSTNSNTSKNRVELSPIIVNANNSSASIDTSVANAPQAQAPNRANNDGHIVSINTDNNFVIIDIGGKDGAKIGNAYRVFRGSKEIAKLEVIQVRRDISAADIKKRVTSLQVGDVVR